jgi:hypothetical protein
MRWQIPTTTRVGNDLRPNDRSPTHNKQTVAGDLLPTFSPYLSMGPVRLGRRD